MSTLVDVDAVDVLLDRNRQLMAEVRALRIAVARVEAVIAHADKISTSDRMSVLVAEIRSALG